MGKPLLPGLFEQMARKRICIAFASERRKRRKIIDSCDAAGQDKGGRCDRHLVHLPGIVGGIGILAETVASVGVVPGLRGALGHAETPGRSCPPGAQTRSVLHSSDAAEAR